MALARLHERIGDLDAAAAAYDQASRRARRPTPNALAAVANFTLRDGTGKEALRDRATGGRGRSDRRGPRRRGARAQVRSEDGPGALETADKAVAARPVERDRPRRPRRGPRRAGEERGSARRRCGRRCELDPKSAARVVAPRARPAGDRQARRRRSPPRRKATELDDKFGEGFAILGGALIAENLKNWSDAIAQAQQGAFLDPKNPIVQTRGRQDLRGERPARAGGRVLPHARSRPTPASPRPASPSSRRSSTAATATPRSPRPRRRRPTCRRAPRSSC